jgi:short-subunit dehydrogenase
LARALARHDTALALAGRDDGRLAQIVEECRSQGADARAAVVDVAQRSTLEGWLASCPASGPIDLLVANAGVTDEFGRPPQEVAQINFVGVINTVEAALPWMAADGHVALLSSLASWRPQPEAPAYAASKAAVRLYGEAIRGSLERAGMALSVVCPGCVSTPMLDRRKDPKPHSLTPERAAEIMIAGLIDRRPTIVFPRSSYAKVRLMALLSPVLAGLRPLARHQEDPKPATPRWRPG